MENRFRNGCRARRDLGGQRPPARHGQPQAQRRYGWSGDAGSSGIRHAGAGGERQQDAIPIYLDYAARIEPIRSITLQARVPGYLQEQTAQDGADVRQGDLLYKISPDDFQAALDQAKAQVQRDTATLD